MLDADVWDESGSDEEVDESALLPLERSPGALADDPDQDPDVPVPLPDPGFVDDLPDEPGMVPGVDVDPTRDGASGGDRSRGGPVDRATIRTGQAAVDFARAQVTRPTPPPGSTDGWFRRCLVFTRTCFNVGAKFGSAEIGWGKTQFRHGIASTPPLGVPVWWTNGGDGHVAISAGDGTCYSTDIKRRGQVDVVAIAYITRHWGQTYRGWTEDVNGVRVYRATAPSRPAVSLRNVQDAARRDQFRPQGQGVHETDVVLVEKALRDLGLERAALVDGYAGTEFRKAYAKFQRAHVPPPYDGIPGRRSLTLMGDAHGFRVVD